MDSIEELTADHVHEAFKAGKYTAKQLIQAFLARIDELDRHGPKLNSILAISNFALAEAEELDAYFKQNGSFKGPLHGIPVLVKDQADTKGIVTTYGSIVAMDNVPKEDATVIAKLKDAGAIILAKTTMPDWATSWYSTSSVSGVTHMPYCLGRDPGGSSSGTAAAIAANLGILGLGEDTGGSIRLPSSFCCLVGLRVTPGLISRSGMSPLIVPQDTPGPMCRTVRDAALMLDVMVGYDAADPYTATAAIAGPPTGGSYAALLDTETIKRARIGVLRNAFGDDQNPECHATNIVVNSAIAKLTGGGTTFIDVEIPDLEYFTSFTSTYMSRSRSDLDAFLAKKRNLARTVAQIFKEGAYHPANDLFEGFAQGPAKPQDDPEYYQRLEAFEIFQRLVIGILASNKLDAIAFPDVRVPAQTHESGLQGKYTCLNFPTNTVIASQARLPAITVPAGFTSDGLPVGLEFVGLPYHEQQLLGLAYGVEQLIKARRPPKL